MHCSWHQDCALWQSMGGICRQGLGTHLGLSDWLGLVPGSISGQAGCPHPHCKIACETLGGWRCLCSTFHVLRAQGMLRVVGEMAGLCPPLCPPSPFAFQLCVKFIKDTLSVEQVCEALQVRVTPVGLQRVKNNLYNFGAEADLILLFSAGQWGGISPSPLAQQPPCHLPDHWDCAGDARDSGATRAWQRSVFTLP